MTPTENKRLMLEWIELWRDGLSIQIIGHDVFGAEEMWKSPVKLSVIYERYNLEAEKLEIRTRRMKCAAN